MFSHPPLLKRFSCSFCGQPLRELHPYVNIFVRVTNRCPAHCDFCANAGHRQEPDIPFDENKLFRIIDELVERDIYVKRLNITGGEPSVVASRVESLLARLSDFPYSFIHAHLNTLGVGSAARKLMLHPRWNSVSVSLHHYDDKRHRSICHLPLTDAPLVLPEGSVREKINASCNLIRGFVDNPDAAQNMMSYALQLGFPRLGFVVLMPVNDYCRLHAVAETELRLDDNPHVFFTGERTRATECRCRNYLYLEGTRTLEIYIRCCLNPAYAESALVYDGAHLYQGFGKGEPLC